MDAPYINSTWYIRNALGQSDDGVGVYSWVTSKRRASGVSQEIVSNQCFHLNIRGRNCILSRTHNWPHKTLYTAFAHYNSLFATTRWLYRGYTTLAQDTQSHALKHLALALRRHVLYGMAFTLIITYTQTRIHTLTHTHTDARKYVTELQRVSEREARGRRRRCRRSIAHYM